MSTKQRTHDSGQQLREALAPYLDLRKLRKLAATSGDVQRALSPEVGAPPAEVRALLSALSALLRPAYRQSITSPEEMAGLLMVEMGLLEQEEVRVVVLNAKHHVIDIITVYRGTINASAIRVAEVFKEALRRNAFAIIVAHNHPSGDPAPSPVIWRIGNVKPLVGALFFRERKLPPHPHKRKARCGEGCRSLLLPRTPSSSSPLLSSRRIIGKPVPVPFRAVPVE